MTHETQKGWAESESLKIKEKEKEEMAQLKENIFT